MGLGPAMVMTQPRLVPDQTAVVRHHCSRYAATEGVFGMDGSIAARGLGTLVLCAIATGCATVTPVPYSEIASSAYMAPDTTDPSGRVPYRYSTAVDWRTYNKAILEPVAIYRGKDHQFGDMSDKD